MPNQPGQRCAALYVDFDNLFASLAGLDEWAAWSFATDPGHWLAWLAAGADGGGPRRLLVRRCYLNPAGWIQPEQGGSLARWLQQPRLYFSRFRAEFVRAGFEVVDCPRLARLKNAADIIMALDIADALVHPTRFDEFVILSGDSDFTPLLHRLRAHDRLSLLVTQSASAQAFRSAADRVIPLTDFAETAVAPEEAPEYPAASAPLPATTGFARPGPEEATGPAMSPLTMADPENQAARRAAIITALKRELAEAEGPLHLPALGTRLQRVCGDWVRHSRYGGAGTLAKLIESVPDLAMEAGPGGGWLYDPARHERPSLGQPGLPDDPSEVLDAPPEWCGLGGRDDPEQAGEATELPEPGGPAPEESPLAEVP